MKAFLEFLFWLLLILAVVVVPVLIEDWHVRHKHNTANPSQASMQCNVALPKTPQLTNPLEESHVYPKHP